MGAFSDTQSHKQYIHNTDFIVSKFRKAKFFFMLVNTSLTAKWRNLILIDDVSQSNYLFKLLGNKICVSHILMLIFKQFSLGSLNFYYWTYNYVLSGKLNCLQVNFNASICRNLMDGYPNWIQMTVKVGQDSFTLIPLL